MTDTRDTCSYGWRVTDETWIMDRADPRAVATRATSPALLTEIFGSWSLPTGLPTATARLWDRACGQFQSGSIAYENFTDAVRMGFEAADSALSHHVRDLLKDGERVTFGGASRMSGV